MSSPYSRRDEILDAAHQDQKRRRRERIIIYFLALLVFGLLYLAIHASRAAQQSTFIQPFIIYFFNFAVWALILVLILVLVFLIVRNVVKFVFERRRGVLGARLRMRLIMAFMALTIGPALVLFLLSTFILNTSIERLYDPHVLNVVQTSKVVIESADRISKVARQIVEAKYEADGEATVHFAEELARALGGTVCASRPVIDQGWLPSTRQVGKSGMTVKPRCFIALGISGAPEHVEGMKDSDLIVAVNTDPNAPIFDVADYGVVADLMDLVPALAEAIKAR